MDSKRKQFIEFLAKDILDWKDAAGFYEEFVHSVQDYADESFARSGMEEANKYRARVAERESLIQQLQQQPDED